jgi:hypothetical protein
VASGPVRGKNRPERRPRLTSDEQLLGTVLASAAAAREPGARRAGPRLQRFVLGILLLLPLVGAVAAALAARRGRGAAAWTAALAPAGVLALLAAAAPGVLGPDGAAGTPLRARWPWVPGLGLDVALRLDALAWLFAVLVAGVGVLVVVYAFYYLPAWW